MYSSGEIAVGADARALASALFSPPLGLLARLFPVTRLITLGLLPDHIRLEYGFTWSAARNRRFRAVLGVIRQLRRTLPAPLREWKVARL